jgi:hypothetical protein
MTDDVQLHKFEGKQYALAKDVQPYFIELANARKRIEALEKALREVISVSDRKTDIYDRARAALDGKNAPA